MKIDEYQDTAAAIDYTPRPNASQAVARAKRARGESEPGATAMMLGRTEKVEVVMPWWIITLFVCSWRGHDWGAEWPHTYQFPGTARVRHCKRCGIDREE